MLQAFVLPFDHRFDIQVNSILFAQGNHLFNEPAYFKLHSHSERDCYFQLVLSNQNLVYITLAFHETSPGIYVSSGKGTFGGLSLNRNIEFQTVEKFLQSATDYLRRQGAKKIRIRCAPASHNTALFTVAFNSLIRQGFRAEEPEVNFSMLIDSRDFINRIDYGNVKRIRKAAREGFMCEKADLSLLPAIHQLIAENRERQGIVVSMTLDQLRLMAEIFPERLHLFAVYRDADRKFMAAAAVCLLLATDVLYVFYWGESDGMRSYSPVAMLASSIYSFSLQEGITLLDVGISTVNGNPNYGLVNFKRNLGFTESLKLDMVWTMEPDKEIE